MGQLPTNKADFYRDVRTQKWGNYPNSWNDVNSALNSEYSGLFSIRNLTPGGKSTKFWIPKIDILAAWNDMVATGANCRINESMPDDLLLWQGDIGWQEGVLVAEGSSVPNLSHRDATLGPTMKSWFGLSALVLLKTVCWPKSSPYLAHI